jgi:hypothetical protein
MRKMGRRRNNCLIQFLYLLDEETEASERANDPTREPMSLLSSFKFGPGFFVLPQAVL